MIVCCGVGALTMDSIGDGLESNGGGEGTTLANMIDCLLNTHYQNQLLML